MADEELRRLERLALAGDVEAGRRLDGLRAQQEIREDEVDFALAEHVGRLKCLGAPVVAFVSETEADTRSVWVDLIAVLERPLDPAQVIWHEHARYYRNLKHSGYLVATYDSLAPENDKPRLASRLLHRLIGSGPIQVPEGSPQREPGEVLAQRLGQKLAQVFDVPFLMEQCAEDAKALEALEA